MCQKPLLDLTEDFSLRSAAPKAPNTAVAVTTFCVVHARRQHTPSQNGRPPFSGECTCAQKEHSPDWR